MNTPSPQTLSRAKVIALNHRRHHRRTAAATDIHSPLNPSVSRLETRVIAITSGKGGVGKTNTVINLGIVLNRLGNKVMILDADVGLGNLDILLGLAPKYNLSDVIIGRKKIPDILIPGPENIKILPAASGIEELTSLSKSQTVNMLKELEQNLMSVDFVLCDTGAGISSNVLYFCATAQDVLVVTSPEPTAITDAYALMKVLSYKYGIKRFSLVVNMVRDVREARDVYHQLTLVAERFLDITIDYMGHVLKDANVKISVRRQQPVTQIFPQSIASRCFESIAIRISNSPRRHIPEGNRIFFWEELLRDEARSG